MADMASAAGASGQEDISEILASMDGTTLGSDTLPESAPPADETPEDTPAPADTPNAAEDTEPDPPKPKRATRKKKDRARCTCGNISASRCPSGSSGAETSSQTIVPPYSGG